MNEQGGRVEDERLVGQYAPRPLLEPSTLDAIRESNLAFLALLSKRTGEPSGSVWGLDPVMVGALAALDPFVRRALAGLPYTLFNLRFEDAPFWRDVVRDASRPGSGSLSDEATFARTAVFLAWHLVQGNDMAPAMVLGMTPAVVDAWRGLPLSALDHAATRALPRLEARWGGNARFWPKLVAAAHAGPRGGVLAVRELGLQLLAAQGLALAVPHLTPDASPL
ncbi:MAG: hypothetical protein NTZ79_02970 [Proteobacteria bacterium]|nr:hypothetical protein [Pseudomonadota bacterium]